MVSFFSIPRTERLRSKGVQDLYIAETLWNIESVLGRMALALN